MQIEIKELTAAQIGEYAEITGYSYNEDPKRNLDYMQSSVKAGYKMFGLLIDGKPAVGLLDLRFRVNLGGRLVTTNGISMVASSPEVRRRGLVRRLLAQHLADLRDDGVPLSLLYPFQFRFYNRLGWALGGRMLRVKVPPKEFAGYGRPVGRVRQVLHVEKDDLRPTEGETLASVMAALDKVYSQGVGQWGLMAAREEVNWRRNLEIFGDGGHYVFLWETDAGVPEGYVILRRRKTGDLVDLYCREMAAVSPDAWRGLFFFLSCHDAHVKHVVMDLPSDHHILELLVDPLVEGKPVPAPMARAVDVAALVSARGAPADLSGELTLAVDDSLAPWNAGVFRVRCSGGEVEAAQAADAGPADVSAPIDVLSQMLVGTRGLDDMLHFGLVTARPGPGLELARRLLPARPIWHREYY